MTDHAWVHENLDTYISAELTTSEREKVERHLAECAACSQALAETRQLEHALSSVFADAKPDANLDDRIVRALASVPVRTFKRPSAIRFVIGAAAVLVIGLIGAVAQAMMNDDGMRMEAHGPVKQGGWAKEFANLRTTIERSSKFDLDFVGGSTNVNEGLVKSLVQEFEKELGGESLSKQITQQTPDATTYSTASEAVPMKKSPQASGRPGKSFEDEAREKAQEWSAFKGGDKDKETKELLKGFFPADGRMKADNGAKNPLLGFFDKPNEKDFADKSFDKDMSKLPTVSGYKLTTRDDVKELADKIKLSLPGQMGIEIKDGKPSLVPGPVLPVSPGIPPPNVVPTGVTTSPYFAQPNGREPVPTDPKIKSDPLGEKGEKPSPQNQSKPGEDKTPEGGKDDKGEGKPKEPPGKSAGGEPKQQPPVEQPFETNRKIIRTGEMEFETDSFDKAIENVTRLITLVKGGFVATVNSDKLPNGKMRGAVVVRMPPQYLDKFVLDLRREMAKSGELKNQRIISMDVTKQYTDIESRLRAARTMEDRLIQIIKIGKGEIKDLVAAEKELGVWRTKIEEMEGEIRYYGNQVSLSTLTIQLVEKEIRAATAIVVTESVRMRLEVDDVAKSHQIAMAAVEEAKGRITKSELKQHSAGQLQSILHAEIPPAQRDAFRDKLKKLGIVSSHEENQSQHTEGGTGSGGGLKPRTSDVQFEVTMHNTANVRPRLTADLKVATSDVPASYGKLLDAINKAKGQVRDGKLNEQDKLNITAILDFNVPIGEKAAIDKVLAEIGPVLERVNVQAPVNELSTDRKFGYTLLLRDFASIPPSKTVIEVIAVTDVPAVYAKLQDAIAKAKGQVADAKLNEQDKLNINAQIDFTVMTEEKAIIDTLLKDLGTSLTRTNVDTPTKQLSTPRKFGYTLLLRDFASVPPSKATDLKIAVTDVPVTYAKLLDAIAKAKGQVVDSKLNEQDKLHITAQIAFSVPSEEKANMDKLLVELGTVLSRNNVQVPANQLATAKKVGYSLDLRDFATIPPSQMSAVTIATSNVPSNYAKLIDAIAKAKGQVAVANLNEQDKLNVTGQINFTVPRAEKDGIEKLLGEIGTNLSRNNAQAPMNELSSDGKFGFAVTLRDFANIPPRETFIVQIALNDVPASFREFQDAVAQARGWINVGKLVEDNKSKIEAQIDFDVPASEKVAIEKLLIKSGAVMSRTSSQVPVNALATDQKVGYSLSLRSTASIPPREKTLIKFEVADVDSKSSEIKDIVLAGKGRVIDSTVDRHENGQVTAAIVFEVPFASQDTLIRQMKGSATKLISQRSTRDSKVPENELTTAQIIVTLTGSNPIVPSDEGVASYVRTSLYLSFKILAMIVMSIIVGLSAIVPCVVLIWVGFKVYGAMFGTSQSQMMPTPVPMATKMGTTENTEDTEKNAKDA